MCYKRKVDNIVLVDLPWLSLDSEAANGYHLYMQDRYGLLPFLPLNRVQGINESDSSNHRDRQSSRDLSILGYRQQNSKGLQPVTGQSEQGEVGQPIASIEGIKVAGQATNNLSRDLKSTGGRR